MFFLKIKVLFCIIFSTISPSRFISFGNSPFSTSLPITLHKIQRKYSCRGKECSLNRLTFPQSSSTVPGLRKRSSVFPYHYFDRGTPTPNRTHFSLNRPVIVIADHRCQHFVVRRVQSGLMTVFPLSIQNSCRTGRIIYQDIKCNQTKNF